VKAEREKIKIIQPGNSFKTTHTKPTDYLLGWQVELWLRGHERVKAMAGGVLCDAATARAQRPLQWGPSQLHHHWHYHHHHHYHCHLYHHHYHEPVLSDRCNGALLSFIVSIIIIITTIVEERMCEAEAKKSASLIVIPI
jgi:hypothetical protein